MLSPNVIIIWAGTNATIPTGFTRVTELDGRYPKGTAASTNPNTTGGASTHTHTSPSHTHTLNAHTHTYTLTNTNVDKQGDASGMGSNGYALDGNHTHTGTSGAANGGTTQGTAVTYAAFSSEPPYYEVIFIESTGYQFMPDDGVILWDRTATQPTGFSYCNGTGGTPDLRGKYLKGAATSGDSGGTGGSTTNNHTIAHGHTANTHTHDAANSATNSDGGDCADNTWWGIIARYHQHSISMSGNSQAVTDYGGAIGNQAETVEPAYTKLSPIQNTSGANANCTKGMVAMWLGTLATIPPGWVLCDGNNGTTDMRSRHLKMTSSLAEMGNTGGSNTHTHAAQTHSHTASGSHSHTATGTGHANSARYDGSGSEPYKYTVVHGQSVTSMSPNYANSTTTADSSNNEPGYTTVAFIEYQFGIGGAALYALL